LKLRFSWTMKTTCWIGEAAKGRPTAGGPRGGPSAGRRAAPPRPAGHTGQVG